MNQSAENDRTREGCPCGRDAEHVRIKASGCAPATRPIPPANPEPGDPQ